MTQCDDFLRSPAVGSPFPHNVGVLKLIIALLYVLTVPIIIFWIYRQRAEAQRGDQSAVKVVIFPVFTNLLWLLAFSSAYIGILFMTLTVRIGESNPPEAIILYSLAWTIQHAVIEGIAFMFLQRGCGLNAAYASSKLTLIWSAITFGLQLIIFQSNGTTAVMAQVIWSAFMLIFYLLLWVAPQSLIFRRPAAIQYSQFWFWFRVVTMIVYIFQGLKNQTLEAIGSCGYIFGPLLFFAFIQPLICYWALLQDSKWWQGTSVSYGKKYAADDSIKSPLLGLDISYTAAQELALVVDNMSGNKGISLLNFAHIYLDKSRLLGSGSFSKVYRGKYLGKYCALKLIFTVDLTVDTIRRVASEAALLSAVKNPNVLNIFGVSVLPPSICMVLELCAFGSLADIVHRDRQSLMLSKPDRIYLGLGCARGLAALHALNPYVTHRDIKSFNFLVDSQLNAKLADLELGQNAGETTRLHDSESMLLNWVAPEILRGENYTQASDIYALGLVLWEIFSGEAPYVSEMNDGGAVRVRSQILSGIHLTIPSACPTTYSTCIVQCWSMSPKDRATAAELSTLLAVAWQSCFTEDFHGLMFSSTPLSKMEEFFDSPSGIAFIEEINYQLNILKTIDTSPSISSFESHGLVLATMKESFLWSTETSLATTARGSNYRNSLYRSRSYCSGDGTLDSTTLQLQELYRLFQNDESWNRIDHVEESALIVTASIPHAIVKSSLAFISLLGYAAENLFCHSLDHYVDYEASLFPEESFVPKAVLSEFYDEIAARGLGHMVIQLVNSENQPVRCSVHGFAIGCPSISREEYKSMRDSLNYSESPTTPPPDILKESSFGAEDQKDEYTSRLSIPFPFLREETPQASSRPAAFYAIYVNPLQGSKVEPNRTRSFAASMSDRVKRLISVGSNLSVGSGVKLSDVEKGLDWGQSRAWSSGD